MLLLLAAALVPAAAQLNPALFSGLRWRNIGPLRAGRVSAVAGVVGQPGHFYIGLPGGGVWETLDAGVTWNPIFDAVKEVDSIGSLAVSASNPKVLYAGTGDLITGLSLNEGNGIYKSSDGGATWQQSGLEHTHRIASLLVDPRNPDLVLAAAQGDYHFKSPDRGVYRSTDGGAHWTKVLYRDELSGARDLAWAADDPAEVFATTYLHYNPNPGQHVTYENGTGLYKSNDEGATWTEIAGHGLPRLTGRTGVAVAQGTHGQRVFLIGGFGLYRSDDGGASWAKATNDGRISGNDYICGTYVDTQNPDIVYVMQTSMYRSTDGGRTFASFKGAPGGDDYHEMWMDPNHADRIILGVDQGATVSLDHGATWSPWYNQSTAQVYRIATDNAFPYWVYATMQDSGAVAVASRGDLGEITDFDWYPMPAGEAGSVAPDPLHPGVIYAGGLDSALVKVVRPRWTYQDVSPGGNGKTYRQFTNPPLGFFPRERNLLYFGSQYVSISSDGGDHWTDISPDLSAHHGQPPVPPAYGRPTPALTALAPSPAEPGVIWAGTNTGLVWISRDFNAAARTATWTEVTPPGAPASAEFNFVQPSHTVRGEAYAEMDNRNVGDYLPHIFRTSDYGANWTEIVSGLPTGEPEGSFVRVVREDPERPGLLYCGTENTVYVSFDDGDHWQSLRLNLPTTSIRDLVVHGSDLVIGTYGRGFWILDDMTPLRQLAAGAATGKVVLFRPTRALRLHPNLNADTPFPPEVPHAPNPPAGASLYYYLPQAAQSVSISIRDAQGREVLRTLSSAPNPDLQAFEAEPQTVPDYWKQPLHPLATGAGMHRAVWDLRFALPGKPRLSLPMTAVDHDTAPAPRGPLVAPGTYQVQLSVDGAVTSQPLVVAADPREPNAVTDLPKLTHLQRAILDALSAADAAGEKIAADRKSLAPGSPEEARLAALAGAAGRGRGGRGALVGAPSLVVAQSQLLGLLNLLESPADAAPTGAQLGTFARACGALNQVLAQWRQAARANLGAAANPVACQP